MRRVGWLGLVALAAASCAVAIKPDSASMRGGDPKAVRAALDGAAGGRSGPVNALGKPMAFVVVSRSDAGGTAELWAVDLEARSIRWRQSADVASRLVVSGPTVVHTDRAGNLIARDVGTGAVKWRKSLERSFTRIGHAAGERRRRRGGADRWRPLARRPEGGGDRLRRRQRIAPLDPRRRGPGGGAGGVGIAGGGAPAVAVGDAHRRPQRQGAGRHPVARAGGHLRARPARGPVLRLARGVHGLGPDGGGGTSHSRRRRLPAGQGARSSSGRCTTTTCTARPRTTTRPSTATACCGGCSPPACRPGSPTTPSWSTTSASSSRWTRARAPCAGPSTSRAPTPSRRITPAPAWCSPPARER